MQARERVVSGRVYKAAGQVVPRVLRLVAAVEYVSLCVCVCVGFMLRGITLVMDLLLYGQSGCGKCEQPLMT